MCVAIQASRLDATYQLRCERFDSAGSNDTGKTFVCYVIIVGDRGGSVISIIAIVIACAVETVAK